eukprot:scaffold72140_cov64-Phaeocystis_antarctica.AAC.2
MVLRVQEQRTYSGTLAPTEDAQPRRVPVEAPEQAEIAAPPLLRHEVREAGRRASSVAESRAGLPVEHAEDVARLVQHKEPVRLHDGSGLTAYLHEVADRAVAHEHLPPWVPHNAAVDPHIAVGQQRPCVRLAWRRHSRACRGSGVRLGEAVEVRRHEALQSHGQTLSLMHLAWLRRCAFSSTSALSRAKRTRNLGVRVRFGAVLLIKPTAPRKAPIKGKRFASRRLRSVCLRASCGRIEYVEPSGRLAPSPKETTSRQRLWDEELAPPLCHSLLSINAASPARMVIDTPPRARKASGPARPSLSCLWKEAVWVRGHMRVGPS